MSHEKDLYVFDFDDTIIRVSSKVLIYDKNTGEVLQEMSPSYFIEFYTLNPNERAEFVDSEKYTKLITFGILREAVSKFKDNLKEHVWICTARFSPDGPKQILEKEGVSGIPIAAVGKKEHAGNLEYNARRKRAFIYYLAKKVKPETVFFYDDSYLNLSEVGSLADHLGIKFVLINTVEHTITVRRPSQNPGGKNTVSRISSIPI